MPELKLKQLQYETDTWKRALAFMMDENIYLKNRLSEILSDRFNKALLDEVELFQNKFLKEDELIGLLRNDITEMERILAREIFEDGRMIDEIDRKLKKVRNNITIAEKQFAKLKSAFNSYLRENIES